MLFFLGYGVHTGSGAHPAFYSNSADEIPQGYSAWGKTLIPLNKVWLKSGAVTPQKGEGC
jgi:hypothetical protein